MTSTEQHRIQSLEKTLDRQTTALQTSEESFRIVFEHAVLGIALLDGEGRVVRANPALYRILERKPDAVRGSPLRHFMHADDAETEKTLFTALLRGTREHYELRARFVSPDGTSVWGRLMASVGRPANGDSPMVIAMVEDIRERQQADEALIQAEKLALTGRLAASLTHEINNPLQTVIGCLGLAEEILDEGGDVHDFLDIALRELKRTARTVAQLRDLNRPSQPEEREAVDVTALVKRALLLTARKCEDCRVSVSWAFAEDLPAVMAVPDRIQQVLLNLVLNALDAMPEGGALHVQVSRTASPSGVRVAVRDTGKGIGDDVLPELFEPFYTSKSDGIGLGLFISQRIVEEHGGRITVESEVGEGTTFAMWLPA